MKNEYTTREEIAKVAGTVLDTSSYEACMQHLDELFPNRYSGYVPTIREGDTYIIDTGGWPAKVTHVSGILYFLRNGKWD